MFWRCARNPPRRGGMRRRISSGVSLTLGCQEIGGRLVRIAPCPNWIFSGVRFNLSCVLIYVRSSDSQCFMRKPERLGELIPMFMHSGRTYVA